MRPSALYKSFSSSSSSSSSSFLEKQYKTNVFKSKQSAIH